jgi:hypothetical protein
VRVSAATPADRQQQADVLPVIKCSLEGLQQHIDAFAPDCAADK